MEGHKKNLKIEESAFALSAPMKVNIRFRVVKEDDVLLYGPNVKLLLWEMAKVTGTFHWKRQY